MPIEERTAMYLWKDVFGNQLWGKDCFGTWIYRDDYENYDRMRVGPSGYGRSTNYGWVVDYIRPASDFNIEKAAHFMNNYEPMHHSNHERKSNYYPHFAMGRERYTIIKCDLCFNKEVPGYGIMKVSNGERIDWKGVQKRCYIR